ncbi:MAG TPA: hypothetical protein VNO34_04765 [Actinomycetota bacterium]|nr:hypothetical protein [Actinomycetota bacterium]
MSGDDRPEHPPTRWTNSKGRIDERVRSRLAEEGVAPADLGVLAVWAEREARLLAQETAGEAPKAGKRSPRRARPARSKSAQSSSEPDEAPDA